MTRERCDGAPASPPPLGGSGPGSRRTHDLAYARAALSASFKAQMDIIKAAGYEPVAARSLGFENDGHRGGTSNSITSTSAPNDQYMMSSASGEMV